MQEKKVLYHVIIAWKRAEGGLDCGLDVKLERSRLTILHRDGSWRIVSGCWINMAAASGSPSKSVKTMNLGVWGAIFAVSSDAVAGRTGWSE